MRAIQSAQNGLTMYDTEALTKRKELLEYYYRNLSKIYEPKLPEVVPVPELKIYSVYEPKIPKIRYPRLYDIHCNLPDITDIVNDLKALRERKCPTCGRGFNCAC